jgi:hypothetical protein
MKFRLATNGPGGDALVGGVGNFFRSLSMAPVAALEAGEQAQDAQAKRELQAAQMRHADAAGSKAFEEANGIRAQTERGGLGPLLESAAIQQGISPYEAKDFAAYAQTGKVANRFDPSQGPAMPVPSFYGQAAQPDFAQGQPVKDDTAAKIYRTLGLMQNSLALGKGNVEDIAKATGLYRNQGLSDAVIAGQLPAGSVGQAQAAASGTKLIENIGTSGAGYNQFTGEGQTLNPGMVALFGDKGRAEIGRDKAASAASYASAGERNASAAKTRQEMELGGKGVLQQTDQGLILVDPRTGTSKPVLGANGQVAGKPISAAKPLTEGQAKANIFGGRMAEANAIIDEMAGNGVTRPGNIKQTAEGIAGAIPIIGDSLAAGAGALTNFTQSSGQQQVEQAQRDFINAVLRRESGAAIAPSEFENARKQYFPQIGDSPAVLKQKSDNRKLATNLMLQEVPENARYKAKPRGPEGSWDTQKAVTVDY